MRRCHTAAFTFVEVLIALLVIGLALVPLFWFMSTSTRETRFTMNEVNASGLASEVLEALQGLPFTTLSPYAGELTPTVFAKAAQAGFNVPAPKIPAGWVCELLIEPLVLPSTVGPEESEAVRERAAQAANLLRITVTVRWREEGAWRELRLFTARGACS